MKVAYRGFAGTNHSWSIVAQNISRSLIAKGHQVDISSTNGYDCFPEDLKSNIKEKLDNDYDLEFTYTAPKNFPLYLNNSSKSKKFGIWTWEFIGKDNVDTFPPGFAKNYRVVSKILPPSQFSKQTYLNAGVPEEYLQVIPHGVNEDFIYGTSKYQLKTEKKIKFFLNVGGQVHYRKNVSGTLEAWGKAFNQKDDVVLVVKTSNKKPTYPFEQYFPDLLSGFKKKYPNHAPIITISEFIPDLSSLYRACDIVVAGSFCEGFGLVALEAMYSNNILIVSDFGGTKDFCFNDNSLLIKGKEVRCPINYQYWTGSPKAIMFQSDINHYAELMIKAAKEKDLLLKQFAPSINKIKENYTWSKVTDQILDLYAKI